eukprot:4730548-Pyramimonas_sp.AAC.1
MTENLSSIVDKDQACLRGREMMAHIVRAETRDLLQHMTGAPYASLFLTDFSAAFPSLSSEWLLRVLACAGPP